MGFPKAALEKQSYLFYDPVALRDLGVSTFQGLCTDSEKGWVTGHHASKVSMAETWSSASLGLFLWTSANTEAREQTQCTEHYLHSCSISNTLFNRTAGDMSLCLLFQITTEKAVSPSVPSSVGSFPKPCHSDYRQFQTFLKHMQASLRSLFLPITRLLCSLSNRFFLNKTCKGTFSSAAIHFPCTSLCSPPK